MKTNYNHMKNIVVLLILLAGVFNVSAQVFDYVVDASGSGTHTTIQSAIDACPDNVRTFIFVKNGTYQEKVMIGSHSTTSSKIISLIGEDVDNVIISWDDYNGKTITYDGKTVTSGTPQSATFTVNSEDFYAENLTIKNEYTSAQAVALYTVADRQTFKNCKIIGFQDTHYLKKARRSFYKDCFIEGGTDYICAGGTAIFEDCTLHSLKNGSYVTAPEDILAITSGYFHGFVFRNCTLTSDDNIIVYLGRPWQMLASSVFISCNMENIKPEGWSEWDGSNYATSFFAEYNSMDMSGNLLDVSNRVSWSRQLTESDVNTYYTNDVIYSHISTSYDPVALVTPLSDPANAQINGTELTWDAIDGSLGYVIYKDGVVLGFSQSNTYTDSTPSSIDTYHVVSVSSIGALSDGTVTGEPTAINEIDSELNYTLTKDAIAFDQISNVEVYNMYGKLVIKKQLVYNVSLEELNKGIYIVKYEGETGTKGTFKFLK